jgi:hypothetical protein
MVQPETRLMARISPGPTAEGDAFEEESAQARGANST